MPVYDGNGNRVYSWGDYLNNIPTWIGRQMLATNPVIDPDYPYVDDGVPHNPQPDRVVSENPLGGPPIPVPPKDVPMGATMKLIPTQPQPSWIEKPIPVPKGKEEDDGGPPPLRPDLLHDAAVTPAANEYQEAALLPQLPAVSPFKMEAQPDGSYKVVPNKPPQQIDQMVPKLIWRDPDFNPKQPPSSILAPWWPTADRVSDWLTGPPGRPQAEDDPAFRRRFESVTHYLPGVRYATPEESRQQLLNNAPWLANLLGN